MKIKGLFYLALFAIAVIIWIDFVPNTYKFSELWEGVGIKFETLIHRIFLAYITSFIFYYVVVYRKEQRNKKQLYPVIAHWSRMIVINNRSVLKTMLKSGNMDEGKNLPTREEFKMLGNSIYLFNKATHNMNWTEYLQFHKTGTLKYIEKILIKINFLDSEHIRILTTLQNSLHLNEVVAYNSPKDNINIESFHSVLYNFFEQINKLDEYNNRSFKKYYSQWKEIVI
jgi:hypothetical protein